MASPHVRRRRARRTAYSLDRPPLSRGRVSPSVGSGMNAYDNLLCEIYFATLEWELLDRLRFATWVEARQAIFELIEG